MKLLILCDIGANRSVTLAHILKFQNHDVLTAGLKTNSPETLTLLASWADLVIITARDQLSDAVLIAEPTKIRVMPIGPDIYPRPFNKDLYRICKRLVEQNPL
jgi:hypothetical protein